MPMLLATALMVLLSKDIPFDSGTIAKTDVYTAKLYDKAIDKIFAAYFKHKFESNRSIADIPGLC